MKAWVALAVEAEAEAKTPLCSVPNKSKGRGSWDGMSMGGNTKGKDNGSIKDKGGGTTSFLPPPIY